MNSFPETNVTSLTYFLCPTTVHKLKSLLSLSQMTKNIRSWKCLESRGNADNNLLVPREVVPLEEFEAEK